MWLVEAQAIRVDDSDWTPLFTTVEEPNNFTAVVEQVKQRETRVSIEGFWGQFHSDEMRSAGEQLLQRWLGAGHRSRIGPNHIVLEAPGPSVNGMRTVIAFYSDGRVLIPFSSYAGQNSGISIDALTTENFRTDADILFGFHGSERQARTEPGWLRPDRVDAVLNFCCIVADAYAAAQEVKTFRSNIGEELELLDNV